VGSTPTICLYYGRHLGPSEARELLRREAAPYVVEGIDTLQNRALATVGPGLYEAPIRGYTRK
jgi:UDP-galactopyranose mutase